MKFSSATQTEIDKLYKGRRHVELTIGILRLKTREYDGYFLVNSPLMNSRSAFPSM